MSLFKRFTQWLTTETTAQDKCTGYLRDALDISSDFDYDESHDLILKLRDQGTVDVLEYLNLLDALNCYQSDGHFENSKIWQRAKADDDKVHPNQDIRWAANAPKRDD